MKKCERYGCTLKDSNLKGRNEIRFCFLLYKVLGYPKELENVPYIFPACYGMRQILNGCVEILHIRFTTSK